MKATHFTSAKLLWDTIAYCDQWEKIMAVYTRRGNLVCVVSHDEHDTYNVLLVGDDGKMLYQVDDIELGTVKKNMDACFNLYLELRHVDNPMLIACKSSPKRIEAYEVLTHTRVGSMRHGQFRKIDDASAKIATAKEAMEQALATMNPEYICRWDYEPHEDDGYDEDCSLDSWLDDMSGGDPDERRIIMSGVFDD